jgi:hypothetical protein
MKSDFLILSLGFTLPGLILLLLELVFRREMKKKSALVLEKYENHVLVFYIIGTIGMWLLLLSITLIGYKILRFSPDFLILFGFISGVIASFRSFKFWALSEDIFLKKHSPEESLGGVGLGCIGIILFPLAGTILGYTMFLIFR